MTLSLTSQRSYNFITTTHLRFFLLSNSAFFFFVSHLLHSLLYKKETLLMVGHIHIWDLCCVVLDSDWFSKVGRGWISEESNAGWLNLDPIDRKKRLSSIRCHLASKFLEVRVESRAENVHIQFERLCLWLLKLMRCGLCCDLRRVFRCRWRRWVVVVMVLESMWWFSVVSDDVFAHGSIAHGIWVYVNF